MKAVAIVLGILLLLGLLIAGKAASVNNELVTQREAVRAAWAQVDVALQRRADLIPNLVETVKGFAAQERQVFETVANARAALLGARTPAEKIRANQELDTAIG
ncbi:MAG: LemA family protein, partial [Bryobacteraceae bacterium]